MYGTTSFVNANAASAGQEPLLLAQNRSSFNENQSQKKDDLGLRLNQQRNMFEHQHLETLLEEEQLIKEHGEKHWKVRLFRLLHSRLVIFGLAFLMLLDILFLVVTLILDGTYPLCDIILMRTECSLAPERTDKVTCRDPPNSVESIKFSCTACSIAILLVFFIELLLQISVIGVKRFFRNIFLIFDLIVVILAISIEAFAVGNEMADNVPDNKNIATTEQEVQVITLPLLWISRSFRLLRIGHGTYKETHDYYEHKIAKLEDEIEQLKAISVLE